MGVPIDSNVRMTVAQSASMGACNVEVRHKNDASGFPPLPARVICLLPPTCDHDRSTRPGKAHNFLSRHPISRAGSVGLTTWKSLPVTVSAVHHSLDRLLPPNGEEILISVVFSLPTRRFESSGAAIGLKGSTRWKE